MTDDPPRQFPAYPSPAGTRVASRPHAKIMMKLMARALQGKRGRSLFTNAKRKKVKIV